MQFASTLCEASPSHKGQEEDKRTSTNVQHEFVLFFFVRFEKDVFEVALGENVSKTENRKSVRFREVLK